MALARLNMPGVVLYGGSIAPGQFHGREVTVQDVFEAVGAHAAGPDDRQRLQAARGQRVSRRRRLRRPVHRQHDGDRLRNARHLGARQRQRAGDRSRQGQRRASDRRADRQARQAGLPAARHHHRKRRSRMRSRWSPRPAVRPTPCCICWRSRSEAGVELELDDFDRISARTPLIADLKPSGRFVATDLHAAGGSPLVIKRLIESGQIDGDAMTVTGRTLGEERGQARRKRRDSKWCGPSTTRSSRTAAW